MILRLSSDVEASREDGRRAQNRFGKRRFRADKEVDERIGDQKAREGCRRRHQVRRRPLRQSRQQSQDHRQCIRQMGSLRQRLSRVS